MLLFADSDTDELDDVEPVSVHLPGRPPSLRTIALVVVGLMLVAGTGLWLAQRGKPVAELAGAAGCVRLQQAGMAEELARQVTELGGAVTAVSEPTQAQAPAACRSGDLTVAVTHPLLGSAAEVDEQAAAYLGKNEWTESIPRCWTRSAKGEQMHAQWGTEGDQVRLRVGTGGC